MLRCLNDLFGGYCSGKPQVGETKDIGDTFGYPTEGVKHSEIREKCSLSPKECGNYLKYSEVVKEAEGLGSGVRIRAAGETAETKKVPRRKKKETLQGTLL